jgi:hypothetical protein
MINYITLGNPSVCSAGPGQHNWCAYHKSHRDKQCFWLKWPDGPKVCDNLQARMAMEWEEAHGVEED